MLAPVDAKLIGPKNMRGRISGQKLSKPFYLNPDVVWLAKDLLGKKLCTHINGIYTSGKIVETEAYKAPEDAGSHAYNGRRTARTETMYQEGGIAYVYLIYGMYKLFNLVTNVDGIAHAVLIRAIEPIDGIEHMLLRRKMKEVSRKLCAGPGLFTQALGIEMQHNEIDLCGDTVWIEDYLSTSAEQIESSARIGLSKLVIEPYLSIPWRFTLKGNSWVSK